MPPHSEQGYMEQPSRAPQAFGDMYDMHYTRVFRFLVGRLRNAHAAEELAADVFVIALASFRRGMQPRCVGSWLVGVADHLVSRYWRRRRVEERAAPLALAEEQDPEELAIGRIESAMLWACVNSLSPEHRQVLLLRVVAGLRAREVGEIMNRTDEAVRSLQLRALTALRSLWKEASSPDAVSGAAD